MKSLQGYLLVASPKLLDPNFSRAVVLIVQHNDQGALGLVLNRPLDTTIDMVWDQVSQVPCLRDDALHQGGPCEGTLMVLHGDASLSPVEVIPGVYFNTEKESVEQIIGGDQDQRPVKFFIGYAGWGPDQLEGELESGSWLTLQATAEHVFEKSADLWDNLRRRITLKATYPWLKSEMIPDDPSVNRPVLIPLGFHRLACYDHRAWERTMRRFRFSMSSHNPSYQRAIELIDSANALDPSRASFEGREYPAELIYSMRMTAWLEKIEPEAPEVLRLAVRCQHLRRWDVPRSQYPMTRIGYLQWRTGLGAYHAQRAAEILTSVGYDEATISRVQSLLRKERLKTDPQTQTLEDVACLVFLENDYVDFARRHEEQKVIDILRKTWRKMSDRGHSLALELAKSLPGAERAMIERALGCADL